MERESKGFVELIYENFSCWNKEIHGNIFFYKYFPINLFPRGLKGDGERLVVQVFDQNDSPRVELAFIGADGSLICKLEVKDPKWDKHCLMLPPGPKFDEVIQTRKDKNLQKDILILRLYRCRYKLVIHGRATIEAINMCIKIPAVIFREIEMNKGMRISNFYVMNSVKSNKWILNGRLRNTTLGDANLLLVLIPYAENNSSFVCTCLSLVDGKDVIIKTEEDKHVFHGSERWEFSGILTKSETTENGFYLDLCVKFISGDIHYSVTLFQSPVQSIKSKPLSPFEITTSNSNENANIVRDHPATVLSELKCLYQDQDYSDFQLNCDSISFPVHKAILSAWSPVFKSMLASDMREAASGSMDIADLEPSILSLFLSFLYTGAVEDLDCDRALKLYYAADKYQVPSLQRECARHLGANVSLSNVCDVLSLADRHRDEMLTSVAHRFVLRNYNEVLSSAQWKGFMMEETLLAAKTLTHFAERNFVNAVVF